MAKIRFLDQVPIGVFETNQNGGGGGGITSGSFTGSFSGSFTGSLQGTASWSENALTSSYSNNINGESYYIPTFVNNNTLVTSSIYQSGSFTSIRNATAPIDPSNPDILYVNGDGVDTYNLISVHADIDSYAQINVQNFSPNSTASSDIVATADIGGENDHYIDMGINGSGYNDPNGVGQALDAYLYSTGQDLLIGNATDGNKIIIFNGDGPALDNARVFIDSIGTVGINASDPTIGNPEALLVEAINNTTYNLIRAKGNVDNFLQTAIINRNTGSAASADIVAYNDLDPDSSAFGFIDMGINSSQFNDPINYPGWNPGDSYVYTDAPRLTIGTSNTGSINFYVGDVNPTSGSKFKLKNNNQHEITGSLDVSGSIKAFSFTGSLLGTSSYATNALSASFASTSSYLNTLNQDLTFNGNLTLNGTASIAYLNVQYESASVIYSSGSNQFGDATNDTQTLIGRTIVSGSFEVTGSTNIPSITGSLLGTASFANNALSSSFTTTSSFSVSSSFAVSSSYALSASFAPSTPPFPFTGSAQITGSLGVTGSVSIASGSLLIRSSSFNGIGLGDTLPTANLQISNTINDNYLLSLDRGSDRAFSFRLGASFTDRFIIHNPSGLTNGSNEVGILTAANLSGRSVFTIRGSEPSGNPSAAIAAIRFEAAGTPDAMQSAFLFVGLSNRIYDSFASQPSFIRLTGTVAASSGTGNFAWLRIAPTINQTGGTGQNVGIIYEPTLTSITGAHYGLVIRPSSTLNGIGHTTNLPTATWHVKGDSDTVGTVFRAENLSNNASLELTNFGSFRWRSSSGTYGLTTRPDFGELIFGPNGFINSDRYITQQFQFSSNLSPTRFDGVQIINGAGSTAFPTATSGNYRLFSIINNHQDNTAHAFAPTSGNATLTHFQIDTYISQSGTANGRVVGIEYKTTGSILGTHYGLLIRPSTLSGFGLGNTLPSASLHIRGGSTGSVLILESNTSSSIFTITNAGSGSYTGSFSVLGGITGSLFGTASFANNTLSSSFASTSSIATSASFASTSSIATSSSFALSSSYALTASFALNGGGGAAFPFTGSAVITGSLIVTGSIIATQNITGSRLFLSASNGTISGSTLTVFGSGSAQPVFTVQGSQGELFSVTDNLSGSLFSVNDISGLPILEVFSDNTTLIGSYQAPALYTTNRITSISGSNVIYSFPTASYDGIFVDYTIRSGSNARAGQVFGIWSGSLANYTDNSTTDFGTTTGFNFGLIISGSNMVLTGSSTTAGWTVKTIIRSI